MEKEQKAQFNKEIFCEFILFLGTSINYIHCYYNLEIVKTWYAGMKIILILMFKKTQPIYGTDRSIWIEFLLTYTWNEGVLTAPDLDAPLTASCVLLSAFLDSARAVSTVLVTEGHLSRALLITGGRSLILWTET